ncbi:hypothetical protein C8J57DRAFT_1464253 [Mycena rebaudengoi]|nr:hypothetical protein C8J57DRAFT_1464253 [Mycena rebaudengoi]
MTFFTPTLTPLQTFSLITANVIQHLIISYHKIADVQSGRLAPSSLAELANLDIARALLERGNFVIYPLLLCRLARLLPLALVFSSASMLPFRAPLHARAFVRVYGHPSSQDYRHPSSPSRPLSPFSSSRTASHLSLVFTSLTLHCLPTQNGDRRRRRPALSRRGGRSARRIIGLGLRELCSGLASVVKPKVKGVSSGKARVPTRGMVRHGGGWRGRVCKRGEEEATVGEDRDDDDDVDADEEESGGAVGECERKSGARGGARTGGSTTLVARINGFWPASSFASARARPASLFNSMSGSPPLSASGSPPSVSATATPTPAPTHTVAPTAQTRAAGERAGARGGGVRGGRPQAQTPHTGAMQALYDGAGRRRCISARRRLCISAGRIRNSHTGGAQTSYKGADVVQSRRPGRLGVGGRGQQGQSSQQQGYMPVAPFMDHTRLAQFHKRIL